MALPLTVSDRSSGQRFSLSGAQEIRDFTVTIGVNEVNVAVIQQPADTRAVEMESAAA